MNSTSHAAAASADRNRAFAALATAGCLWGTGFLFGKWAFDELSASELVLYRFVFASIGFAPITWRAMRNAQTRIARQDYSLIFIAALLGVPVQFLIQFEGLARDRKSTRLNSSHSSPSRMPSSA